MADCRQRRRVRDVLLDSGDGHERRRGKRTVPSNRGRAYAAAARITAECSSKLLPGASDVLADDLPLFSLADLDLRGRPVDVNLAGAFARDGETPTLTAVSASPEVASVVVASGTLTVTAATEGEAQVTVTARYRDGTETSRTFAVTVTQSSLPGALAARLFPRASDAVRQGFARIVNRSAEGGEVHIAAFDDAGTAHGPVTLSIAAGQTRHFNSDDLESGNPGKGLSGGVGTRQGDWRLTFETDLDVEALSYIRTRDGFLTTMHDAAPPDSGGPRVVTFNPGSNLNQRSLLRITNPGAVAAEVTIRGIDDAGETPGGDVRITVPPGSVREYTAAQLEAGLGTSGQGALGDGIGKWRLEVESSQPLTVMSLLESPTGHVTNLSTATRPSPSEGD